MSTHWFAVFSKMCSGVEVSAMPVRSPLSHVSNHSRRMFSRTVPLTFSPCVHGPTIAWYRPVTGSPAVTGAVSGRWKYAFCAAT